MAPSCHLTPKDTLLDNEKETGYNVYIENIYEQIQMQTYTDTQALARRLVITSQQNTLSNGEKETGYNVYVKNMYLQM